MTADTPRFAFIMVNEVTVDNLIYTREKMVKDYNLAPENISDIIDILINYWYEGKRHL
jgi:hypothetical protein